jgi:dTDP-glucose 4,6-dehydratase
MRILITGGCGFIGSAVVRHLIGKTDHAVCNLDKMTYAATATSVESVASDPRYSFRRADVADASAVREILREFEPDAVMHVAAESHVDRSIDGPQDFLVTNVLGTGVLLEAAREYLSGLGDAAAGNFRFLHVSTDEVFGALDADDPPFSEKTAYAPGSPYSASKASADHLVRAWYRTYGLPTLITNSSNNYGPFQFPEKLIPLMILKAAALEPLPVYGTGRNIRDWLFVEDHARALVGVLEGGQVGESYVIGGGAARSNLAVVEKICDLLDTSLGVAPSGPRRDLIEFVDDRPGHDFRYAVDDSKVRAEIGWRPDVAFDDGLVRTVEWFLANEAWWRPIIEKTYGGDRFGLMQ